jgi:hypothetical protein
MEKCVYCGAATLLLVNGTPICVSCDEKREPQTEVPPDSVGGSPERESIGTNRASSLGRLIGGG